MFKIVSDRSRTEYLRLQRKHPANYFYRLIICSTWYHSIAHIRSHSKKNIENKTTSSFIFQLFDQMFGIFQSL